MAMALLSATAILEVARQQALLLDLFREQWWVDATLPMLELVRRRVRGLVRFIQKGKKVIVYIYINININITDTLGPVSQVDLPGLSNDFVRVRERAKAYLRSLEHHAALQRLRRNNKQLTPDDHSSLE